MPILTIDSARLNGTPSAGTVRITASRSPLMDSGSNTVYSGTQTFPLDAQGKLSVTLPATDSPSLGAPFTYTVEANLASGQWIYRGVKLPSAVATIDITDAQSASQQVYPTRQEWDAITAGMNTAIAGKVTGAGMTVRRDTTVGTRVLLDHPGGTTMLMGDTGWRTLTSWDAEGNVTGTALPTGIEPIAGQAGSIRVRRETNTVHWSLRGFRLTANAVFNAVPTAFIGDENALLPITLNDTGTLGSILRTTYGFQLRATTYPVSSPSSWAVAFSYPTTRTWPTTLPGTP